MSSSTPVAPLAVTVDQAAAMLSVHVSTVFRWLKDGRLPSSLIGGCRRIRVSDIEALLDANQLHERPVDQDEATV